MQRAAQSRTVRREKTGFSSKKWEFRGGHVLRLESNRRGFMIGPAGNEESQVSGLAIARVGECHTKKAREIMSPFSATRRSLRWGSTRCRQLRQRRQHGND